MKKKLFVTLVTLLVACIAFAAMPLMASADEPADDNLVILIDEHTSTADWWDGAGDKYADTDFNVSGLTISKVAGTLEYNYFVFDITGGDTSRGLKNRISIANWPFAPVAEQDYFTITVAPDGSKVKTDLKTDSDGRCAVGQDFVGTVVVPLDAYRVDGWGDDYSTFKFTSGGPWSFGTEGRDSILLCAFQYNVQFANVGFAKDYAPLLEGSGEVVVPVDDNRVDLIKTYKTKADWFAGDSVGVADFEKDSVKIGDYNYMVFEIAEGDTSKGIKFEVTAADWPFTTYGGQKYFTITGEEKTLTELTTDSDGRFAVGEDFVGTVVVPLDIFRCPWYGEDDVNRITGFTFELASAEANEDDVNKDKFTFSAYAYNVVFNNIGFIKSYEPLLVKEGELDYTALNARIALAQETLTKYTVSEDGMDVSKGKYWVSAAAIENLETKLAEAEALEATTQDAVNAMVATLDTAIKGVEGSKAEGKMDGETYGLLASTYGSGSINVFDGGDVNRIQDFNHIKFDVDASDVTVDVAIRLYFSYEVSWGSQDVVLAYSAGKDFAEGHINPDSYGYSLERADRAYFLVKDGDSKGTRMLTELHGDAGIKSEEGKLIIPAGFKGSVYVSYDALRLAYTDYQPLPSGKLFSFGLVLPSDEDLAVTDLRLVNTTIEEGVNFLNLQYAIASAEELIDSVYVSVDGSDVAINAEWVTEADKTAYASAISAAKVVLEDETADQETVDGAKATLDQATVAFESAMQAGLKDYFAELTAYIAELEERLTMIEIADLAEEVDAGVEFVTATDAQALLTAIENAKTIRDNASQATIEAEIATLTDAENAFDLAVKVGTKGQGGGDVEESESEPESDPKVESESSQESVSEEENNTDGGGCMGSVGASVIGLVGLLASVAIIRKRRN